MYKRTFYSCPHAAHRISAHLSAFDHYAAVQHCFAQRRIEPPLLKQIAFKRHYIMLNMVSGYFQTQKVDLRRIFAFRQRKKPLFTALSFSVRINKPPPARFSCERRFCLNYNCYDQVRLMTPFARINTFRPCRPSHRRQRRLRPPYLPCCWQRPIRLSAPLRRPTQRFPVRNG